MNTSLLQHWCDVVVSSDGELVDVTIYIRVQDVWPNDSTFEHLRAFKASDLKEVKRTTTMTDIGK